MSIINISNLTFAYDGSYDNIFTDVSFRIDTDWKLGFTGRNGRGKTTFLKLLMGQYEYRGTITASVDFEYFPFDVADLSCDTLGILSSIAPDAPLWRIQKELFKLEVGEDALYRPFNTLSNGERTKVLLAGLFLRENSFLLIDEPTNHLDMTARRTVARYLNSKNGFILVSHDRAFMDECVDHVLSINKADIEVQSGNFSSWFHNKQMRDDFELAENEKLKKDIKRLEKAARQSSQWADKVESTKIGKGHSGIEKSLDSRAYIGEKSRRMQQRRKNIERRQQTSIDEKSELLKNIENAGELKIRPLKYHTSRLITLEDVTVNYGGRDIVSGVGFTVEQGDRIALLGGNGSGKSSLLKLIRGENIPHSGAVNVPGRLSVSYVPQDTSFLSGDLDSYAAECQIDITLFKAMLRKLDFSRVQFDKDMLDFSAGQKKKVLLARSLCERAHLYIWDEPLNYIDVLSRVQIEDLILEYHPTLLFVEHDRSFVEKIAEKVIDL
ncbi:MAG: ABC-F type ribosomal protection protein [Oscillospiraceae bacterium]|nr:ABC-F type ribosomal protection protein [Oscillospiraceae bacterium]